MDGWLFNCKMQHKEKKQIWIVARVKNISFFISCNKYRISYIISYLIRKLLYKQVWAVMWPERHQLLRQQRHEEERSPVNWWEEPDGSTGGTSKVLLTKRVTLISPFSSNWQWIDATRISFQRPLVWARGVAVCLCPKTFPLAVSLAVSNATLVSHLIVPLSAGLGSQPAAGPAHVQCTLSPGLRMFSANLLSEDLLRAGGGDVE